MRNPIAITLLLFSIITFSANGQTTYARAKIDMQGKAIQDLAKLGIDVTHGLYASDRFYRSDFADFELENIQAAGFDVEIEIEDVSAYYVAQNDVVEERNVDCDNNSNIGDYPVPENFELGSLGGFFTYEEMLGHLDAMAAQYPDLISFRAGIEGAATIEGRKIFWLRISDNPNVDEDEPEVLYDALHHAREPNSLSQLIFFMWYLLENYETDPEIQYLVDHTELYFVPCINPDGYIYNETTNPAGGGLWRKNRRENFDGSFGVDLNRNYGFEWGFDDSGSSPNPESATYRGTAPFSEPETQAMRDFCNAHEFQIALNYHTFGNLLIYPWGYSDQPTEEADVFDAMAEIMTLQNSYTEGTATETVGYIVNGVSDDWMYGEVDTKPAIYAMTPEVGRSEEFFWPPMNSIIPNSQASMWMNMSTANLVHNYGLLEEIGGQTLMDLDGEIRYNLKRYGLKDGELTVSLTPITSNITSVGLPKTYNLDVSDSTIDAIEYTLDPMIQTGAEVVFQLSIFNGEFSKDYTLTKTFSDEEPALFDAGDDLSNWTVDGLWGTTTSTFVSAPSSITDSPDGNYPDASLTTITLSNYVSIEDAVDVKLNFWARWDIEPVLDYAQIQIAVDNDFFFPVCGKYTVTGGNFQDLGEPIYEGLQNNWVQEEIDLSEYVEIGDAISIRFIMAADGGDERDGYYFDDMELSILMDSSTSTISFDAEDFVIAQNRPNPATTYTNIDLELGAVDFQQGRLKVYNALGQLQHTQIIAKQEEQTLLVLTKDWPAGLYFYQVELDGKQVAAKRMTVVE